MLTYDDVYEALEEITDRVTGEPAAMTAAFFDALREELEQECDGLVKSLGLEGVWDLPELPLAE